MTQPFEATLAQIEANVDGFVDAVFASLDTEFFIMPKGPDFVEYPRFEAGYEALKKATKGFDDLDPDTIFAAVQQKPVALIVLRTMLGFTPPEWAAVASMQSGVEVTHGAARSLDRDIRKHAGGGYNFTPLRAQRTLALIQAACQLLEKGCPEVPEGRIHRLNMADSRSGKESLMSVANMGIPYPMLLYERFLGRPFAAHRDSVSDEVGDILESKCEDVFSAHGVTYRKTKRAEKVPCFDPVPDFFIPSEFSPAAVIEAKIANDDGTARDKVSRIMNIAHRADEHRGEGKYDYEVIAVISGPGFGVRRELMKGLLMATKGKVFTPRHLYKLVECTRIGEYVTKQGKQQ